MSRILECKEPLHFHHDGCPACSEICNSCYEHELVCNCEGKVCKLECNHCDLDYIQEVIYNKKKGKIMRIMNKITSTFDQIMDFYEWLLIDNNGKGLRILTAWMSLGLLFALIELWTRSL